MLKCVMCLAVVLGLAWFSFLVSLPDARGQDAKEPVWKHGLEFRVRKAGEKDFNDKTTKFGAEVFLDKNANQAVYITETGCLGVAPAASLTAGGALKPPGWLHALELKVRKADETDWDKAVKFGVEVFKDANTGNLVYISQTGDLAVVHGVNADTATDVKKPQWLHGLELKARKGGEKDFNEKTTKFGIEVFKDENAGTIIYISQTGALAVVPAGNAAGGKKAPTWLHGLEFKVRKAGEADFSSKTLNIGAEMFRDENTGFLVYITETGSIAVVPGTGVSTDKTKAPEFKAGIELAVRKAGEANFTKDTKKYGGELFIDLNTNNPVYISETGAIAVAGIK